MALTSAQITLAFQNVLQRDPSAAELSAYLNASTSNALTDAQVYSAIVGSAEALNGVAAILRVYQAAFGRVADQAGLNQQTDSFVRGGFTINKVAEGFVVSQEFANRYNGGTLVTDNAAAVTDAFLQSLYVNVLGRLGSAAEIAAWKATLTTPGSGYTKASDILIGFSQSPEFVGKAAAAVSTFLTAAAQGTAVYSGALLDPAANSGSTFTLTTAIDTITGTAGADTIDGTKGAAAAATLTALDNIDGGDGTDTLKATQTGALTVPDSAIVKNVENVELTTDNAITADVQNWTGLLSLKAVAGAAAVDIDTKSNVTSVAVTGGTTVAVDDNGAAGADKLATVSLSGNADAATITSDALTKLAVSNTAKDATVTAAAGTRVLELTLDNVTGGTVADAQATTLNVASSGTKTTAVTLNAAKATTVSVASSVATTITDVNIAAAKSLTVTGAGATTITGLTTVTALTSVDATGSTGGLTLGKAIGTGVTFTGGAGKDGVIVGATTKAITTAGGDDTVTVAGVSALGAGGSIDAGEGTDTLKFSTYANAVTASATATFEGTVSGFERLELSGVNAVAAAAINLANLDDINYVTLSATNTETTTISGMTSGGTIAFKADQTAGQDATVAITNANTNTTDVLNVVLSKATALANVELIAADIETVNITSTETATTLLGTVTHALELNANAAKSLVITGNAGVTFGPLTGATALTSIDASGVTTGLVSLTTAALANAATIKGGAGANTITASAATKAVTYTGSDKVDTIVINNAQANVISTAGGDDNVTVGSGAVTVDLGAGADTLVVAAAATQTSSITLGAGNDTVDINAVQASAGAYLSLKDFAAGDKIDVAGVVNGAIDGATLGAKVTLGGATTFANYIDAIAAGDGTGNSIDGWFQLGGNTYLVVDNSVEATFRDGFDIVIEITGTVDLTNTTQAGGVYTLV